MILEAQNVDGGAVQASPIGSSIDFCAHYFLPSVAYTPPCLATNTPQLTIPVGGGNNVVIQPIYQQVENYVVYPIVYRRAVELSGLTTIVAVLIAGSLLGVVGAILAVPFAAVIKIVIREAGAPRRARMAALRQAAERERVAV